MSETVHHQHQGNAFVTSAQSTLHCLTGCVIGEVAGLMIGVSLGIGVWPTIILATTLAYISGFTLGLVPVIRHQGKTCMEALQLIWIGEAISIGVMEIAMDAVDYGVEDMGRQVPCSPHVWARHRGCRSWLDFLPRGQ